MMKIHIFLLQTSTNKINDLRPDWFDYEKCFVNLLKTIKDRDWIKLNIIFDGKIDNHFTTKYFAFVSSIQNINSNGNASVAYSKLIEFIKNQTNIEENDIIYILENDYLHLYFWPEIVMDLFNIIGLNNYVSLYDHNDKYIFNQEDKSDEWGMYKNLTSKIIVSNHRHWRNIHSTCGSFLLSKKIFDEDYDIHVTGDADNGRFDILEKAKKRKLFTPIPSLSTHCINPFLAPCIDWKAISDLS